MSKLIQEALQNNDIVSFLKKDDNGTKLHYSGYIKEIKDNQFDFESIYGSSLVFKTNEVSTFKNLSNSGESALNKIFQSTNKSLKYLVFDTETTGLPKNWNAPMTDTENWPRVIQLAWTVHDEDGQELSFSNIIVRPDGFEIPKDSIKVHGITNERAIQEGIPITEALERLSEALETVDVLVAHNISFDETVVGCEFYRASMKNLIPDKYKFCTKESSVDYCRIEGRNGRYKWASLDELYRILFNETFENQHDAYADVLACAKCFFELKRLKVI